MPFQFDPSRDDDPNRKQPMCVSAPTDIKAIAMELPQSLCESVSKDVCFRAGLPLSYFEGSLSNYETRSLKGLPV